MFDSYVIHYYQKLNVMLHYLQVRDINIFIGASLNCTENKSNESQGKGCQPWSCVASTAGVGI